MQHFLCFNQNQQEMCAVFMWLNLKILLAPPVPLNNVFLRMNRGHQIGVVWDVHLKQQGVIEFLVADKGIE